MKSLDFLRANGFDPTNIVNELGEESYIDLVNDFYGELYLKANKLIEFMKNNDMVNYAIIVHNIKSECLYLGINSLANMAYNHELKSKANDLKFIKTDCGNLIAEVNKVLGIIKVFTGK